MSRTVKNAAGYEALTPETEPFIDLVQIRSDTCFGTGLIVDRGLVLTALHCVFDVATGTQREGLGVYLLRDLARSEERHLDARILWPAPARRTPDAPDVALIKTTSKPVPVPLAQLRFGELPGEPLIGSARGFPRSAAGRGLPGGRIEHDQAGRINYTSLTRRTLTIDATGPHAMEGVDRWAGLSGGPLIARGFVVGVMREVPEGWLGEAIEAEPLAPLLRQSGRGSLVNHLPLALPLGETTPKQQPAEAVSQSPAPPGPASSISKRLSHQLLNRVENYWIQGALEESLLDREPMELPLRWAPEALSDPFDAFHQRALPGAPGACGSIVQAFDAASQNLLILGAPGSGKSTFLLRLLREMIARARQDSDAPIPVVLSLSVWAQRAQPLDDWIVAELTSNRYGVPNKIAREWVDTFRILPLLDGLDEIPSTASRENCILAINAFRRTHGLTGLAVVGRRADYERLSGRLELDGCVMIEPPEPAEVARYLASFGDTGDGHQAGFDEDPDLLAFLSTPLTVNLTVRTSLASEAPGGTAPVELSGLVPGYVRAMFQRRAKEEAFSKRQTLFTLVWLARNLDRTGLRSFSLTDLQPDWLRRKTELWIYRIANQAICRGFAGGLTFLSLSILAGVETGLFFAAAAFLTVPATERILPVGRLMWDGRAARANWHHQALNTVFWAIALSYVLAPDSDVPTREDWVLGTSIAVFSGLADLALTGLVPAEIRKSSGPREVIRQTAQSAVFGSLAGLIINLVASLIMVFGVLRGFDVSVDVFGTLFLWAVFGAVIGLAQYGGYALVQQYILRLLLVSERSAPFRLADFLNYAASRTLLLRVGGHYTFLHRVAMEYFVGGGDRETEPPRPIPAWAIGGSALGVAALLGVLGMQWVAVENARFEARRMTEYGYDLIERGDFESASHRFADALEYVPKHGPALYGAGRVAAELDRDAEAVERFRVAAAAMPENAFVLDYLGISQLALGETANALRSFERALLLYPSLPTSGFGLAISHRRLGDYAAAGVAAQNALAWRGYRAAGDLAIPGPEQEKVWVFIGQMLEHMNDNRDWPWQDIYVTFETGADGVYVPAALAEEYPDEMTIRINEWFSRLRVGADRFSVTLNFQDTAQRITIPYAAISHFSDASSGFWLNNSPVQSTTDEPQAVVHAFDALLMSELFWSFTRQGYTNQAADIVQAVLRTGGTQAEGLDADWWIAKAPLTSDEIGWALLFLGAETEAAQAFSGVRSARAALGRAMISARNNDCSGVARDISDGGVGPAERQHSLSILRAATECALPD